MVWSRRPSGPMGPVIVKVSLTGGPQRASQQADLAFQSPGHGTGYSQLPQLNMEKASLILMRT